MGRPRLPTELKALKGTLNTTREKNKPSVDTALAKKSTAIFPEETKIACPKTIKSKYVKAYWKKLTAMLVSIRVLSPADIPQLEQLCLILEKLREVQKFYSDLDPLEDFEEFSNAQKVYIALSNKFDQLGSKYYISPAARTKLTLDELNVIKTGQEIQKNESAISAILGGRK